MESKQLALFALSCREPNHSAAARRLGVAPSTLSTNLRMLEAELGLSLFSKAPEGHKPNAYVRRICADVEAVLQRLEVAETLAAASFHQPSPDLVVRTSFEFVLGRISHAAGVAARTVHRRHTGTLTRIGFSSQGRPEPAQTKEQADPHVVLTYESGTEPAGPVSTFVDPWVVLTNVGGLASTGRAARLRLLAEHVLKLPDLPEPFLESAGRACAEYGLGTPVETGEDVGALPWLVSDPKPFVYLVPESVLCGRYERAGLWRLALPDAFASRMTTWIRRRHPAAETFVSALTRALESSPEPVLYRPGISLRQASYFLAVAETRSVTGAARRLNVSQPAVSMQLRKLERRLGGALFGRGHGGVVPTPLAARLAEILGGVPACLDEVRREAGRIAHVAHRRLTVGTIPLASHSGFLIEAVGETLAEMLADDEGVSLRVLEAPTAILCEWVKSGKADVALVETAQTNMPHLDLQIADTLGVISNPAFEVLAPGAIPFAALAGLPLVLPTQEFGLRRLIDEEAQRHGLKIEPRAEVNSLITLLALTVRTPVASIFPFAAVQEQVANGSLRFDKLSDAELKRRLSVIFSNDRTLSEVERRFVGTLTRKLYASAVGEGDTGRRTIPTRSSRPPEPSPPARGRPVAPTAQ